MLEYVLQPSQATLSSGELRAGYFAKLHAARNKAFVPRQAGVGSLADLRDFIMAHGALREVAAQLIAMVKVDAPPAHTLD